MQNTNTGSDNSQGGAQKSGGISWSMPPASSNTNPINNSQPSSPVQPPLPTVAAQKQPFQKPPTVSKNQAHAGEKPNNTKWLVGGIVVLALVAIGWNAFGRDTVSAPGNTATETTNNAAVASGTGATPTTATPKTATANNLMVPSPQDAGMQVVVSETSVSAPTWLVVYELYEGKPVRALGATMFFPEHNGKGGVISLLRATQPNTAYFVGQSLDGGDHTFTMHVNKEVLDVTGAISGVSFRTK